MTDASAATRLAVQEAYCDRNESQCDSLVLLPGISQAAVEQQRAVAAARKAHKKIPDIKPHTLPESEDAVQYHIENVEHMLASKEWVERIAEREHMTVGALARMLWRHNRPDLARPFQNYLKEQRRPQ